MNLVFSIQLLQAESPQAISQAKSRQVRFLLVWSTLNYKFHSLAVYLHSTFTTSPAGGAFGVQPNICNGAFFAKNNVLRPLAIFAEEFHRGCLTEFKCNSAQFVIIARRGCEEKLSTIGAKQENLGFPLPPNSPDLLQKHNKMKSRTDLASSFPWATSGTKIISLGTTLETFHFPETVPVFSNLTAITQPE